MRTPAFDRAQTRVSVIPVYQNIVRALGLYLALVTRDAVIDKLAELFSIVSSNFQDFGLLIKEKS